jgi:hypothetical protein
VRALEADRAGILTVSMVDFGLASVEYLGSSFF